MELSNIDNLVISIIGATKLPIEFLYRSKGGDQPLSDIQMCLSEDDEFPIPNYFLILKGTEEFDDVSCKKKYLFTRYLETFLDKRFNELYDISTLHSDNMNHDTLKEDGFECIWKKK